MSMLTSERVNGIKHGFWSPATKEAVVQRLGPVEAMGPRLIERACTELCRYRDELPQKELSAKCEMCPLVKLENLIKGRDM